MKVVIAAGGTGGHLFPGIALAQSFSRTLAPEDIVFVGTPRGLESRLLAQTPWKLVLMSIPSLKDRQGGKWLAALSELPMVLVHAMKILREERADLVIGVGGYVGGPIVLAAKLLRLPTAILEPNAYPGITNRWLGKIVDRIFIAFEGAATFFPSRKMRLTGNAVRQEVLKVRHASSHRAADRLTLLCVGGSQGARSLNQAFVAAIPWLAPYASRLRIVHQTGAKADHESIAKAYHDAGLQATVLPFIDRMAEQYQEADLVVARSGATTVAELMSLAKPSLLVPYPHAADNHQHANALEVVKVGGAMLIPDAELTGERLAREVIAMVEDSSRLMKMALQLEQHDVGNAAEKIVAECLKLVAAKQAVQRKVA